jgi:hypothetical protein
MNPRRIDPKDFPKDGSQEEQIRFILAFAVLAPSTHNTQPWLFKIEGDTVHICANKEYLLPQADKQRRDFFISFGCLFENLVTAGEYFKVLSELTIRDVSDSDGTGGAEGSKDFDFSKPIASARFTVNTTGDKNQEYERAFNAMLIRINARGVFQDTPVDAETKNTILSIAAQFNEEKINTLLIDDKEKIKSIAALTKQGLMIAYKDKSFRREMSGWMNSNLSHKKEGIPGYALKMPFLMSLIIPKLIRYKDIGAKLGQLNERSIASAPLITVITAKDDSPRSWINVGMLAERLFIELYARNYQTSIFVSTIEMGELYKDLQKIVATTDRPQFLFVVGKVDSLHTPTPRHDLEKKII